MGESLGGRQVGFTTSLSMLGLSGTPTWGSILTLSLLLAPPPSSPDHTVRFTSTQDNAIATSPFPARTVLPTLSLPEPQIFPPVLHPTVQPSPALEG